MFIHVTNARYCGEYKVWLSFNDGTEGEVNLASELYGQVFEPLKDSNYSGYQFVACSGFTD